MDNAYGRLHAAVQVSGAEPGPAGTFIGRTLGFTGTIAAPVLSVYTLTLSEAIDARDAVCDVNLQGTAKGFVTIQSQSDTTIVIKTYGLLGVAQDLGFYLTVHRKSVGAT